MLIHKVCVEKQKNKIELFRIHKVCVEKQKLKIELFRMYSVDGK